MEAYTQFEIARIETCLENIKISVSMNTSLNEKEKQEIIRLTKRVYYAEIEYLIEEAEMYYMLYAKNSNQ